MTSASCFDTILLLARPAAGKSEIIDYLSNLPLPVRLDKFHVGRLTVLDDFPMLWTWFEEDAILEQLGYPRLHTDSDGYFLGNHHWNVLIRRLCLDHTKWRRDKEDSTECQTSIIEFSRGSEHGGYTSAFEHISPEVARHAAIVYVDVSWEESLRKNQKRFNPNRPDSILEHALPDSKLEQLYREVDWDQLTQKDPEFIQIQGVPVPYVVFKNDDDVTTERGAALSERLETILDQLWHLWLKSQLPKI